jgi:hypothetical protein
MGNRRVDLLLDGCGVCQIDLAVESDVHRPVLGAGLTLAVIEVPTR